MLSQALNVYALAGADRNKQWINIALSYLKACESGPNDELLAHQEDSATYITNLVESLKVAADQLNERSLFLPRARSVVSLEVWFSVVASRASCPLRSSIRHNGGARRG